MSVDKEDQDSYHHYTYIPIMGNRKETTSHGLTIVDMNVLTECKEVGISCVDWSGLFNAEVVSEVAKNDRLNQYKYHLKCQ